MLKSIMNNYASRMPKGVLALFFIQMFSLITFSTLYSTLVLYLTKGLAINDFTATSITATFVAFNYSLHLLGGYIGGKLFSYRSLFVIGMALSIVGALVLSIPTMNALYFGLTLFLTGAGLNVTCINCMLTQLFKPDDLRRETAFLYNYSGMNVGFFVGFSISGYLQLRSQYHLLFMLGAIASSIAFIIALANWRSLRDLETPFIHLSPRHKMNARIKGVLFILGLIATIRILLEHSFLSNQIIVAMGLFMLGVLITIAMRQKDATAKSKMFAFIILALMSVMFWALYQLAPMGLSLFIERNVNRNFLGFTIAPQWAQNINTIVIIFGAPLFSTLFMRLRSQGVNLNIPLQFSAALILIGIAFAALPLGIYFANPAGYTSFGWIIFSYVLQSVGELFISPIGFAMIGRLAPVKYQSLMMGTWLMITGVAATISNYFSKMALGTTESKNPLITNISFSHAFLILGVSAISLGIFLYVLVPFITKLTRENLPLSNPHNA